GHLEGGVVLTEGGGLHALQGGDHVLKAVAGGGGTHVHGHVVAVHTHLGDEDIELLGQVDIHGGLSAHLLTIGKACTGGNALVVLFLGGEDQDVLALESLRHLGKEVGILLGVLAASHHDGLVNHLGHGLGVGHAVLHG